MGNKVTQNVEGQGTTYQAQTITIYQQGQGNKDISSSELSYREVGVPDLPEHCLQRPELVEKLKKLLISPTDLSAISITAKKGTKTSVKGMAGIGKTVHATLICKDSTVRLHFKDGILWITIGREHATSPTDVQSAVVHFFTGERVHIPNVNLGLIELSIASAGKCCLIVLDDVWQPEFIDCLSTLNKTSQLLITTRRKFKNVVQFDLGLLSNEDSRTLLLKHAKRVGCSEEEKQTLQQVLKLCGNLPLALTVIGAMMGCGVAVAWQDILDRFVTTGFPEFTLSEDMGGENKSIFQSMLACQRRGTDGSSTRGILCACRVCGR